MRFLFLSLLFLICVSPLDAAEANPKYITSHVTIYKEPGRFAGWPANNGIWVWENEIVVGFSLGYHKEQEGHTIDRDRPSKRMQARSLDGGHTWVIEETTVVEPKEKAEADRGLSGALDFTDPNFAVRLAGGNIYYSFDRCHTWEGPYALPKFGRPGLLARTDYLVEGNIN